MDSVSFTEVNFLEQTEEDKPLGILRATYYLTEGC